jgi:hypothetical protein
MYGSFEELRTAIKAGKVTLEDAVKFYLSNIEKGRHPGAFLSVYGEEAIEKQIYPLLPISLKILFPFIMKEDFVNAFKRGGYDCYTRNSNPCILIKRKTRLACWAASY